MRSRHLYEGGTDLDSTLAFERQQPRKRRRTSPSHISSADTISESGSYYGYKTGLTGSEAWTEAMRLTQASDVIDAESNSSELQNTVSNGATSMLDVSGILWNCLQSLCQIRDKLYIIAIKVGHG